MFRLGCSHYSRFSLLWRTTTARVQTIYSCGTALQVSEHMTTTTGVEGQKPSFLGLLNRIALAEAGAGVFLSAWCVCQALLPPCSALLRVFSCVCSALLPPCVPMAATRLGTHGCSHVGRADCTADPEVEKTLRLVANRETEHALAFEKRIIELGYSLRRPDSASPNPLMDVVTDPDISDKQKFEKSGLNKEPDPDKPDIFDNMMSAKDIDPITGALIGRYIAEERDSGRAFRRCYAALAAREDGTHKAARSSSGGSGLIDWLERLSKLHLDGCLTESEFAEAKKRCLLGAKL